MRESGNVGCREPEKCETVGGVLWVVMDEGNVSQGRWKRGSVEENEVGGVLKVLMEK